MANCILRRRPIYIGGGDSGGSGNTFTVKITSSSNSGVAAYVIYNGQRYTNSTTLTVPANSVITLGVYNYNYLGAGGITVNGSTVLKRGTEGTYDYTVTANANVSLDSYFDEAGDYYGQISLTTT